MIFVLGVFVKLCFFLCRLHLAENAAAAAATVADAAAAAAAEFCQVSFAHGGSHHSNQFAITLALLHWMALKQMA